MLTANRPKTHKSIMKHFVRSALFPENSVDETAVLLVVAACNLAHGCQCFSVAQGRTALSLWTEGARRALRNVICMKTAQHCNLDTYRMVTSGLVSQAVSRRAVTEEDPIR
jgi:hypothetical protein